MGVIGVGEHEFGLRIGVKHFGGMVSGLCLMVGGPLINKNIQLKKEWD